MTRGNEPRSTRGSARSPPRRQSASAAEVSARATPAARASPDRRGGDHGQRAPCRSVGGCRVNGLRPRRRPPGLRRSRGAGVRWRLQRPPGARLVRRPGPPAYPAHRAESGETYLGTVNGADSSTSRRGALPRRRSSRRTPSADDPDQRAVIVAMRAPAPSGRGDQNRSGAASAVDLTHSPDAGPHRCAASRAEGHRQAVRPHEARPPEAAPARS